MNDDGETRNSSESDPVLPIRVKIARTSIPVLIEEEDGSEHTYSLRDMTGTERDQYIADMSARAQFDAKGNPSRLKTYKGMQSTLISRCLYDADERRVEQSKIDKWPALVQQTLFLRCQKMNGLGETAAEESKNG